jgi:hypothetical protein
MGLESLRENSRSFHSASPDFLLRVVALVKFVRLSRKKQTLRRYIQAFTARLKSCPDTKPSSCEAASACMLRVRQFRLLRIGTAGARVCRESHTCSFLTVAMKEIRVRSVEKHSGRGEVEQQVPPLRFAPVGGCDFFISLVVSGRKAVKSICQQASPGSFDCAR